ncbi:MAG: hypothetical protein HY303_00340 [Candidatus Wallbacteria bacterium]|nr:hypothetical protein [Candidatus Wallbacteria bacterium]
MTRAARDPNPKQGGTELTWNPSDSVQPGRPAGVLLALLATVSLVAGPAQAAPSPDGLSGIIRLPSAFVQMGTATYRRGSEFGASFTYPVMPALEAGLTRERGEFGIHAKAQILQASPDSFMPAIALGVQDIHETFGKKKWFWAASLAVPQGGPALHAGVRRSDGPLSGTSSTFGGLEMPIADNFKAKTEYDWGTKSGSAGVEVHFNGNLVAYDYILDAFGSGPASSNLIGISFQDSF